jgi:hypothetical protein
MSLETVDGEGVRISGLADTLIAMSDDDANGIYTVTVDLFEGDHTYNFRNDWSYESGDSLGACASGDYGNDRSVTVVDADVVLDTVCWELCVACPVDIYGCTDPSAANYDPNATIDDGSCLSYPAIIPEGVIVINEIHYNPSSDQGNDDNYEFLELYNTSDAEVDLSFTLFTEGINHVFEYGTTISAGGYLVLAKDSSSYSSSIEWESGSLGNGGEDILLANGVDSTTIDFVDYDDGGDWPSSPDGDGPTLELINPSLDNAQPESWAASAGYGSPGSLNSSYMSNEDEVLSATEFILHNNYPNPFNPTTTISFILPNESFVSIFIIDMLGRMVKVLANGERMNGYQKVIWDGTNDKGLVVAAGVYLYKIQAGEFVQTKKMVLLK